MEQENANFESSPLQQEMIWEQKVEEISQEHEDRATKDLTERKKKFQTAQMHPLKRSYDKISNAAQVIAGDDEPQQGKNARGQSSSR